MKTVATTQKKYMTIAELDRLDRGPVYTLNNLTEDFRGMIIIPVARKSGNGHDIIRVPPTFIPIDLTEQVAREQLLNSTEFRQAVGKGLIRLLTAEYALRVLQTEEAQVEQERVAQNMSRAKAMIESMPLTDGKPTRMVKSSEDDEVADITAKVKATPNVKVVNLVTSALKNHEEVPLVLANLRNMISMKLVDMTYVKSKLGHMAKIAQYMDKEIARRKAAIARKKA